MAAGRRSPFGTLLASALLAAVLATLIFSAADASAATSARADFSGDGVADLAVGAPLDSVEVLHHGERVRE